MRQAEEQAGPLHISGKVLRVGQGSGHGLVAHHVDARGKERLGNGIVGAVGGGNGDEVDAVLASGFAAGHLFKAGVGARDVEVGGGGAAALWIRGERGGDQLVLVIDAGGDAVDCADKGSGAAAHHAQA